MIRDGVYYVGVNDKTIDLFEGQYVVPNGMAYNSYAIIDSKIAILDSVDANFNNEWLDNVANVLQGRLPDYLIVQHMEPDHSANIINFINAYPNATVVSNAKSFKMMENYFRAGEIKNKLVVNDGDKLDLGGRQLTFVFAPMVHWPEVMLTYDERSKILFSADAFGKFGSLDTEEEWACEARRYYFGIVGKYGVQVQSVLKKIKALEVEVICPLHGPILEDNLSYYINLYDIWSSYGVESEGVCIAYTSVYGNTEKAVKLLEKKLLENGCPKVAVTDLARGDMAEAVEDAFRYGKLVLATTTYNGEIFPFMREFIDHLVERNFQNRTVGFIENGSWAPLAKKIMSERLQKCKNLNLLNQSCTILSSLSNENQEEISKMAEELCVDYKKLAEERAQKNDMTALFKIGYGLYVITSKDGEKHNGFICNTVSQITDNPKRICVSVNKQNYSYHLIKKSGELNVNVLSTDAPFSVFERYGFSSGRNTDKFKGVDKKYSDNGLVVLPEFINSYMSLKVEDYIDLGTHGTFVCSVTEAKVINDKESMTYAYYHSNVKPKPNKKQKGFVCKICGYVLKSDVLPDDFVCPLCKHGAQDFEPII